MKFSMTGQEIGLIKHLMEVNHKVKLEVGNYRIFKSLSFNLISTEKYELQYTVINRCQKAFNNTEGTIKNGQSRETGNIGQTVHKTKTNKIKTKHNMCYTLL